MISTVLLCPPDHYQIEYEINPWMNMKNIVDKARVYEEFEQLVEIYKKVGLEVIVMDPQPGLPDMVYTANHGFVIDDIFIKANFKFPQRRKESDHTEKLLKGKGYKIKKIPEEVFFEGQGDLFYRDGKFFMGHGKRTMKDAHGHIKKIVGEDVITIEVNDPYYYHLDTCFAPLGKGIAVIKPDSFSKDDVAKIKKNFKKVIEVVEKQENPFMCCNIVAADGVVVAGRGIGKRVKREIEKAGRKVIETPMDEFFKGGGSIKCLTLEFFKSENN